MLYGLIPLEKGGAVAAKPFNMLAKGMCGDKECR